MMMASAIAALALVSEKGRNEMKLMMVIIICALWTLVRACRLFYKNTDFTDSNTPLFCNLSEWIFYPIHAIIALIEGIILPGFVFILIFLRYF